MEAGIDDVVKFYYSRTWNEDKLMTLITPEWNVLMLTTGSMYPETRNRERYPTLVSISPIQAAVGAEALLFMLHNYNWTDMTIIFDAAGVAGNNDLITILREQASRQNPKLWLTLLSTTSGDAGDLLRRARSVSRVIFLSMHPTMVRKYMLIASDLSMTNGDFVYFVPQMARAFVNGNLTWQNFDDSDQVAFAAFQSVIQLAPCTSVDLESSFVDSYFRDMANISQRDYAIPFLKGDNLPSDVTVAAYYAFRVLKQITTELLQTQRETSGWTMATGILNRTFYFGSGANSFIDHGGHRRSSQCFRTLNRKTGAFEKTLKYDTVLHKLTAIANKSMEWSTEDHKPPQNEPPCGYSGNNWSCQSLNWFRSQRSIMTTAVAVSVTFLALMSLLLILFLRSKHALFITYTFIEPGELVYVAKHYSFYPDLQCLELYI
ncbi:hypothetical protein BV898_18606 [Hypsibius exemplaris]|uniref:Receptor ligand binding region domain-containing protein n=1 Tax=Hypsibius exemplaris TaxID=2072580 RepID=A0A9X6NJK3_HYPEX|nr:hypothetical protein BV898_18606 [Hypsibius exemplaris]